MRISKLVLNIVISCTVVIINGDKEIPDKRVVLVTPVLAPPKNSKARVVETAKDYPVLTVLATSNDVLKDEPQTISSLQPIYVKVSTETLILLPFLVQSF